MCNFMHGRIVKHSLYNYACKNTIRSSVKLHRSTVCKNTPPKKAAGAGKKFTIFFCVILDFNSKCVRAVRPEASFRCHE